jgi:tRNA A-37 threonylcarbamoyl transferase component Bud32
MGAIDSARYYERQHLVVELSTSRPVRARDLEGTIRLVVESASRALGVERVSVWMHDESGHKITCTDLYEASTRRHSRAGELTTDDATTYMRSLSKDRVLAASDVRTDPRTRELESYLAPLGITSMMDAPIRRRGRLAGVLCHEHVGEPRQWSFDEQIFAASLADLIALTMESAAPQSPALADLTGSHDFEKYKLITALGEGGMAEVFLAVQHGPLATNRLVVIKRLRHPMADDPEAVAMFLDEARLASRLRHPNVVHTCDVGEHQGAYFLAMEYLEGVPLSALIEPPAPEMLVARMVADALAGLHHAHTARDLHGAPLGIVHRDVSPQNVFVTYEGITKIVDFGIAKARTNTTRTKTGIIKGKLSYMAPEQAEGADVDARTDVYGMGIVLWELLAGQRLRAGLTMRTIYRVLGQEAPRVSTARPTVDPRLDAIVACALERDPARRFQTADAMRKELEDVISASGQRAAVADLSALLEERFGARREAFRERVESAIVELERERLAG